MYAVRLSGARRRYNCLRGAGENYTAAAAAVYASYTFGRGNRVELSGRVVAIRGVLSLRSVRVFCKGAGGPRGRRTDGFSPFEAIRIHRAE